MKVKIFLMALSLIVLSGCKKDVPEFPVDYFYTPVFKFDIEGKIDPEKTFCAQYPLIDRENIVFGKGVKVDIKYCNGMFGMNTEDTPKALNWIREILKKKQGIEL